jgi:hypothetical protein
MDSKRRIPHESVRNSDDGLEGLDTGTPEDVEAHGVPSADGIITHGPGTGGDIAQRRPSTGGELIDENDVQGHVR